MGYNLNWHVEKRVIYLKLFDSVSADDLVESNEQTVQLIHSGTQPIHMIIDTLGVKAFPNNLRWVIHMIQHNDAHAAGWRIIINTDPTIHVLLTTILSVLHTPIHICNCPQDAHDFLRGLEALEYAQAR